MVGREGELAGLADWVGSGVPVQVYGPSGVGKSALLREFAARYAENGDVVYLSAAGLPVDDIVQELFQACYDATDYKPEPARLRRLMGSIRAVVVVDDFGGSAGDLATLFDAAPACEFVVASRERTIAGDGRALRLVGLDLDAARVLLARELDRPLHPDEQELVRRFHNEVGGFPLALVQAAAARVAGAETFEVSRPALAGALASRLSPPAHRTLRVLCAFSGLPVSLHLLSVLVGDGGRSGLSADAMAAVVMELTELRLVTSDHGRIEPAGELAALVAFGTEPGPGAARYVALVSAWAATADLEQISASASELWHVLQAAARADNHVAVCDLARILAPVLARSLRWGSWRRVLALGLEAAQRTGVPDDVAYFTHEDDVRRRALGLAAGVAVGSIVGGGVAAGYGVGHAAGVKAAGVKVAVGKSAVGALATSPVGLGTMAATVIVAVVVGIVAVSSSDSPGAADTQKTSVGAAGYPSMPVPTVNVTSPVPTSHPAPPPGDPVRPEQVPGTCPPHKLDTADFGEVDVGAQQNLVRSFPWLQCDNEGSMHIQGADSSMFSVTRMSCPPEAEYEHCVFRVTFTPRYAGTFSARLVVPDDFGKISVTMSLTGTSGGDGGAATSAGTTPATSVTSPTSSTVTEPSM